jgi:hypothetical protein
MTSTSLSLHHFTASISELFKLPQWLVRPKVRMLLLVLLCMLGVVYLVCMNSISVSGYKIQQWENKISDLNNDAQQLAIDLADKESLVHIQKRLDATSFIPANQMSLATESSRVEVKK